MHHSDESEMQCNKGITFTSDAKSAFHYLKKNNNTSLTGKRYEDFGFQYVTFSVGH